MRKYIFLIRGENTETYEDFTARMLDTANTMALLHKPDQVKLTVTASPPPAVSIIPFKKTRIAALSVYDPRKGFMDTMQRVKGLEGVYQVKEAIPVAYTKTWADHEPTPGVCLLTLFKQKKGIDYDTFIDRWHNSHTPLSLKLHPLWNYNRNVVVDRVKETTQPWDGIVEEHFKTASDLLNPFRFFGNPLAIGYNMLRVYLDTKSFLDYKTIEPYLAREYHIMSHQAERAVRERPRRS